MNTEQYIFTIATVCLVSSLFFVMRLQTKIDSDGIHVRFFHLNSIMGIIDGMRLRKFLLEIVILYQNMEDGESGIPLKAGKH